MPKTVKCPNCGSTDFEVVGSSKKSLSLSKAIAGGILLEPLGAAGGAIIGNKGRTTFACHHCGSTWTIKL